MSREEENTIVNGLSYGRDIQRFYVTLKDGVRIWTWKIVNKHQNSNKTPLVFIHGTCASSVVFFHNYEELAKDQVVYSIDLPGFGLSERVDLGLDGHDVEKAWTEMIDQWRELLDLDRMILVGHSLGAYVGGAYLIRYPARVERVFFCDPWGWQQFDPQKSAYTYGDKPFIQRILITIFVFFGKIFTPLVTLRLFGAFGIKILKLARPEMFELLGSTGDFIIATNMFKPTGENGFMKLHLAHGYAKHPMSQRTEHFPENVPMHFLFGSRSWISPNTVQSFISRFKNTATVTMIQNAGHQIYLENPKLFNATLLQYIDE